MVRLSFYYQNHRQKLHYISASNGIFAIYAMIDGGTNNMYYIHKDYLGSLETVTDGSGQVREKLSFDPWGRRRNPTNWTFYSTGGLPDYIFDRGYTGHEHFDEFDLINMNGRVYDSWLGRFLSPDPFVQAPTFSQSYNRYCYVFNNPLKYTDPTGYTMEEWLNTAHNINASNGFSYGTYKYNKSNGETINTWTGKAVSKQEVLLKMQLVKTGFISVGFPSGEMVSYNGGEPFPEVVIKPIDTYEAQLKPQFWETSEIASSEGGWVSYAWNNAIVRAIVPDFLGIGVGFNGIAGAGGGSSIEFRWVTRGHEASWKPMITTTQSIGGGYQIDATLNLEAAIYIENVNNIRRSMMQTSSPNGDFPTIWGAGSVAAGGKIGVTGYITPNVAGSVIIGGELNLGAGLPAGPLPANGTGGVSNTWILHDFYK